MISNKQPNANVMSYAFSLYPSQHTCYSTLSFLFSRHAAGFTNTHTHTHTHTHKVSEHWFCWPASYVQLTYILASCSPRSYSVPLLQTFWEHHPDICPPPPLASYFCPVVSSTASDAWSQCSPVPKGSCFESPHINPYMPKNTRSPDVFVAATIWNRDEEAIPLVHVTGPPFVSDQSVCGSIPKSPVSLRILWEDAVRSPASRTPYSFPCPSADFCATFVGVI
jgi:hypothetical protein